MLLLAWCLVWAHATTSLMDCASYIGFRLRPVSGTSRLLMHMVHTGRCPPYLKNVLHPVSSSSGRSGLRSATTAQYVKPRLRTVFGERAFSFAGPKSWNDLPSLPHTVTSTDSFKRQLKTYLFNTSIRFYSRLLWSDCFTAPVDILLQLAHYKFLLNCFVLYTLSQDSSFKLCLSITELVDILYLFIVWFPYSRCLTICISRRRWTIYILSGAI